MAFRLGVLCLLLWAITGSSCEHCQEGATYSGAVISPNLGTTKMMRVPHAMSVSDCIAACCDLSGCDLSWMFGQRCYIISCQHKENCEPKKMENVKSYLTFVLRPSQRTVSLLEFGQVIPSMVNSVGLKNELSEEVSSLKELSVFGKDPSLEEIPEYIDDYETLEQDPFQVSIKHEQKESTDYGDWGPMVAGENSFNSSVDDGGDNQEDFAEKKGETGKVESLLNKNSSELSSVTERSIERRSSLPEIAPFHRRTSENRAAVQLLAQPDDALQKETATPSLSLDKLDFSSGASEKTQDPTMAPENVTEGGIMLLATGTVSSEPTQQFTPPATTAKAENNTPPVAVAGPDKELTFPVESVTLDGSKSQDDQGIVFYHWENISGPSSVQMENGNKAIATVTGLQIGTYRFRLTVKDQQGLSSASVLSITVKEENNSPPRAHAGGKHVLVLPNNSVTLDGSRSSDDQGIVSYLWIRDGQSPAAGDVIHGSDHEAVLQLTNLVEGNYTFHLKVMDANGDSDIDSATVEVRPDLRRSGLVELILQVGVGQLSEQQMDTLVRQLAVLLNVLDSDIKVQKIEAYSDTSTAVVFYVQNGHPSKVIEASDVSRALHVQLLKKKADFLLFKVLRVDTAACLLKCSGHGHCDPITKRCICNQLWMESLIHRYLNDGESNCEWSILCVTVSVFILVGVMVALAWFCIRFYKSTQRTKIRKKTKYTMLDSIDEQERMELQPKCGIEHRSTKHDSCLMVSESEFDSDQVTIFSREKMERENPKTLMNGSVRNGVYFNYSSKDR